MNNAIEWEELLERVEDDIELLLDLISLFEEETPKLLHSLKQAVEKSSYREMCEVAHGIKGIALNFSAPMMSEYALKIEQEAQQEYPMTDMMETFNQLQAAYDDVHLEIADHGHKYLKVS